MATDPAEVAHGNSGLCQKIVDYHVSFYPEEGKDWQSCPELPTPEEILEQQQNSEELPHNPVDKAWDSKSGYLAAQYKILRREGIEGLRFSVRSYIKACELGERMMDNDHTAIYVGVRVRSYLLSRLGPIARVEFSTARSPLQIKWLQSKRLTPGTIVALTTKADNFKTVCKVATIAQRPYYDGLDRDPPVVDLMWADPRDAVFDPDLELVMIESRDGYFESTRHTLVGLQHVARGDSPLDKYLIGARTTDEVPAFVQASPFLDVSTLVHNMPQNGERTYADIVEPLRDHYILGGLPDLGSLTTLDHSQLRGVQGILSKELAIVQGPPGTGKTFTSVEALKVMVATRRRCGGPPIIVSAQTNHALDQILGHCLEAGVNICRVGGRTESEVIKQHTVYEIRQREGVAKDQRYKQLVHKRLNIERKIHELVANVFGEELLKPAALLKEGIITQEQFDSLDDDTIETTETLRKLGPFALWLGDNLIRASIVEHKHPTQQEADEAAEKLMVDWEFDEDVENIAEDEEDAVRIEGDPVFLQHFWTGEEPDSVKRMEHHVQLELARCDDLFEIDPDLRGGVYRYFQATLLRALTPRFGDLLVQHRNACNSMKAHRWYGDAQMLENSDIDIVGCTTTGLTKYRGLLAGLRPLSLLIEEAAETREANITAALYPTLQQLILVGDHQQLAPRCEIRWLGEAPYNLNVSLFQRMVNLNMPFVMLSEQRRMKPEIRRIVSPFYPDLVDHPDVLIESRRPDVPGMGGRNCWYFNHSWPENTNSEQSKYNETEADMVVRFFSYLVANGTDPAQITILTYYKGQRKLLLNRLKREGSMRFPESSFRVHTVDSYQGEENDIILLSLVRSLLQGSAVGFLDDQRRAVVAISRARRGFYVFGNINNLLLAHHDCHILWAQIWNGFASQERVKNALGLPLICQKHGNEIWVKEVEDWGDNAGGCDQQCGEIRPCGHACTLKCHFTEHERLPCSVPCKETLECGHGCQKFCSKACYCSCKKFREIMIAKEAEKGRLVEVDEEEILMSFEQQIAREMPSISFVRGAADRTHPGMPPDRPRDVRTLDSSLSALAIERNKSSPGEWIGASPEKWDETSPEKWNEFTGNIEKHDADLHRESRRLANMAGTPSNIRISDTYNAVDVVDGRRINTSKPRSTHQLEVPFQKKGSAVTGDGQGSPSRHPRSERSRIRAAKHKKNGKKSTAGSSSSGGTSVRSSPSTGNRAASASSREDNLLSLEEIDLLAGPLDLITGLGHGETAAGKAPVPAAKPDPEDLGDLLIDFSDMSM